MLIDIVTVTGPATDPLAHLRSGDLKNHARHAGTAKERVDVLQTDRFRECISLVASALHQIQHRLQSNDIGN